MHVVFILLCYVKWIVSLDLPSSLFCHPSQPWTVTKPWTCASQLSQLLKNNTYSRDWTWSSGFVSCPSSCCSSVLYSYVVAKISSTSSKVSNATMISGISVKAVMSSGLESSSCTIAKNAFMKVSFVELSIATFKYSYNASTLKRSLAIDSLSRNSRHFCALPFQRHMRLVDTSLGPGVLEFRFNLGRLLLVFVVGRTHIALHLFIERRQRKPIVTTTRSTHLLIREDEFVDNRFTVPFATSICILIALIIIFPSFSITSLF